MCLTKFDLTNFSVFFAKLHKYYMFDDYFQKKNISCGYSLILMYITMIWFNCQKKLKFINGSEKWPNFCIKESKYDIAYGNFLNVKTHFDHHFDLKYERSRLNYYGSSLDMLRLVRSVCQTCEKSTQFFTIVQTHEIIVSWKFLQFLDFICYL